MEYETKRVDEETKQWTRLFVDEKGVKAHWRYRMDASTELEGLQYKLESAIAKVLGGHNTGLSLYCQSSSTRRSVEGYGYRFSECTERYTAAIADDCSVFLYDLFEKAQAFFKKL